MTATGLIRRMAAKQASSLIAVQRPTTTADSGGFHPETLDAKVLVTVVVVAPVRLIVFTAASVTSTHARSSVPVYWTLIAAKVPIETRVIELISGSRNMNSRNVPVQISK